MKTKESMKLQELQKLAEKVQLEIKPEEVDYLLESLSELEKLLVEFRKLKLEGVNQPHQTSVKITLRNLHQLTKEFLTHVTEQKIVHHNAIVSAKNFLTICQK